MKNIIFRLKEYKYMTFMVIVFLFIQTGADLLLPTYLALIIDKGVVRGDLQYILNNGMIMLGIAALGGIGTIISSYYSAKIGLGFSKSLREDIFQKVSDFSLQEVDHVGTASLITRTTNDVIQVQNFLISALRMFVRAPIMAIGGIILALSMDPSLSMILAVVVIILIVMIIIITSKTSKLYKKLQEKLDNLNLLLRERLVGIRVLRAFNREEDQMSKYNENNKELTDTAIKINRIMAVMMPGMMLLMNFSAVAILWFGAWRIESGDLLVGNLLAFIQYASLILFSFIMMTMLFIMYPRAEVSGNRINEVLSTEPGIVEDKAGVHVEKIESVEFQNVSFGYFKESDPVLKGISFSIKKGEKVGIIGGTGSGKSTLVNLIPRFYDVSEGSIKINGIDIKNINQSSLRSKIGYVPQESFVMSGRAGDNIRFGKENIEDSELMEIFAKVQLKDYILKLPEGIEGEIYQRGKNLSGGQKQRFNIGRALAGDPDIYIFDDSFSALDYKTDALIRKEIQKLVNDSIVMIVAQRVTTIMDAEKIILLDNGQVKGIGTHKELLQNSEIYREIVSSQLAEEELL